MMERRIELLREPLPFSARELAQRRHSARLMAWRLGLATLLLYAGSLFFTR